jgi:alpha-D-ribose 1-methylphosphonate 5-triphosphate diphosphatase
MTDAELDVLFAKRGEVSAGKRADLICVHVARDVPVVRSVWREG